jgi:hypothetical protein
MDLVGRTGKSDGALPSGRQKYVVALKDSWLLKTLHTHAFEELATLHKMLEEGVRGIETNYTLRDGETKRLLLYHSRVQNRVAKWLALLGQSKADRLGLVMVQPSESNNGENGDAALE